MFEALKRLITINPMGVFIYTILSKWYITMMVGALVVTFWVFKGLQSAGVISEAEKLVGQAIHDSKAVAKYCVPKITNISVFLDCINNLPDYIPDQDEIDLENKADILKEKLNKNMQPQSPSNSDPYYDNGK